VRPVASILVALTGSLPSSGKPPKAWPRDALTRELERLFGDQRPAAANELRGEAARCHDMGIECPLWGPSMQFGASLADSVMKACRGEAWKLNSFSVLRQAGLFRNSSTGM